MSEPLTVWVLWGAGHVLLGIYSSPDKADEATRDLPEHSKLLGPTVLESIVVDDPDKFHLLREMRRV